MPDHDQNHRLSPVKTLVLMLISTILIIAIVYPRYLTKQFLSVPGEVKYAFAGEFPKLENGAYICEGVRGDSHPYKVVSTSPPKVVYVCNSFWLDNLPAIWMNLTGASEGYSANRTLDALPDRNRFESEN